MWQDGSSPCASRAVHLGKWQHGGCSHWLYSNPTAAVVLWGVLCSSPATGVLVCSSVLQPWALVTGPELHACFVAQVLLLHAAVGPVSALLVCTCHSGSSGALWPCNACVPPPGCHFLFVTCSRCCSNCCALLEGCETLGCHCKSAVCVSLSAACEHASAWEGLWAMYGDATEHVALLPLYLQYVRQFISATARQQLLWCELCWAWLFIIPHYY
jgi:hypothetical protein